jgi:RNA polymerase sigma factor (sigma-70 family)
VSENQPEKPEGLSDEENQFIIDFVFKYGELLQAYAAGWVENEADAEDLVQEAFKKMIGGLRDRRFEVTTEGQVRSWFYTVIRHGANSLHRRPRRSISDPEVLAALPTPERASRDDDDRVLLQAVDQLPEKYRTLVTLKLDEPGVTDAEIADRCGRPLGTIKSMMSKAREMLREIIHRIDPDFKDTYWAE